MKMNWAHRVNWVPISLGMFVCLVATARAQVPEPDVTKDAGSLRTTNERLLRENEALREEIETLKKKLAEGKPTTRPVMLSAGAAANGTAGVPRKIVYIIDASGSMMDAFDDVLGQV